MKNKTYIVLAGNSNGRKSSKNATARRWAGQQDWPIDLKIAGQTLAMTEAGAKSLIAVLQAALRSEGKRS